MMPDLPPMSDAQLYLAPIHVDGAQRATSGETPIRFCWKATAQNHLRPFTVEFRWYVGATLVHTDIQNESDMVVTSPSYSPGEPRMPNADAGKRSPTECFVASRLASDLPAGTVSLVATIRSGAFSYTYQKPMRAFNHRDGTLMPCTAVRYVDTVNGNDANNGLGWGTAVRTVDKAIQTMRTALTYAGSDLSGGTINVRGVIGMQLENFWHTSAPGWLHIVADSNARLEKSDTTASPGDTFYMTSNTAQGLGGVTLSGSSCRVHFVGFEMRDAPPNVGTSTNIDNHLWIDNCEHVGSNWAVAPYHSVRLLDKNQDGFGQNGAGPLAKYYTGHRVQASYRGIVTFDMAHDCIIEDWIGGAVYMVLTNTSHIFDVLAIRQRNGTYHNEPGQIPELASTVRGAFHVYGTGGLPLRASMQTPGVLLIEGPVGMDFVTDVLELVPGQYPGSTPYFGVSLKGFTTPGLNGPRSQVAPAPGGGLVRRVLGAGFANGRTYILLDAPGYALGAMEIAPNGEVFTSTMAGDFSYREAVHGDCLAWAGTRTRDVICGFHTVDYDKTQTFFSIYGYQDPVFSCWIEGSATSGSRSPMSGTYNNCLFRNWSHNAALFMAANGSGIHAGSAMENCVMRNLTGGLDGPGALAYTGMSMLHCHVVQGNVVGTNTTTGPAWVSDPAVAPFHLQPLPVLIGSGLPGSHEPKVWAHTQGAPSKGATRQWTSLTWALPADLP